MATATKTAPTTKKSIGAVATLKGKTITAKNGKAEAVKAPTKSPTPAKVERAPKEKKAVQELTLEQAQGMAKKGDWVACVKLEKGTIYTLQVAPGIFSNLLVPEKGKANFVQTHVDRVNSPRHLPRTLRILGSWLGSADLGFENGARKNGGEDDEE